MELSFLQFSFSFAHISSCFFLAFISSISCKSCGAIFLAIFLAACLASLSQAIFHAAFFHYPLNKLSFCPYLELSLIILFVHVVVWLYLFVVYLELSHI
jgi:hypothetical protein